MEEQRSTLQIGGMPINPSFEEALSEAKKSLGRLNSFLRKMVENGMAIPDECIQERQDTLFYEAEDLLAADTAGMKDKELRAHEEKVKKTKRRLIRLDQTCEDKLKRAHEAYRGQRSTMVIEECSAAHDAEKVVAGYAANSSSARDGNYRRKIPRLAF